MLLNGWITINCQGKFQGFFITNKAKTSLEKQTFKEYKDAR